MGVRVSVRARVRGAAAGAVRTRAHKQGAHQGSVRMAPERVHQRRRMRQAALSSGQPLGPAAAKQALGPRRPAIPRLLRRTGDGTGKQVQGRADVQHGGRAAG